MLRILLAAAIGGTVLAQQLAPSPIQPAGPRVGIPRNCGLQATADGLAGGGATYQALFTAAGVRFEAALGRTCPTTQYLTVQPVAITRGSEAVSFAADAIPIRDELVATYARAPGLDERYDVGVDGMQLSWRIATRPAGDGDLVVRYAVDTNLPAPTRDGDGLRFEGEHGGVRIGGVTGIDARGARIAGTLQWRDAGLELALPAAFVEHASYPIVLDPLFGTVLPISNNLAWIEGNADVDYESSSDRYLVLWEHWISATSVLIRGQLLTGTGQLSGQLLLLTLTNISSSPHVAALRTTAQFGITWTVQSGATGAITFMIVDTAPAGTSFHATVASGTGSYASVVLGCETDGASSVSGFVLVYEDDIHNTITRHIIYPTPSGWFVSGPSNLWSDSLLGASYHTPAISRRAGTDHDFLVVAQKSPGLFGSYEIVARVVDSLGNLVSGTATLVSSPNNDLAHPAVDGSGERFVAAWERLSSGSPSAVEVAPLHWTAATTILTMGNVITFGGGLFVRTSAPTVCYGSTRTWLGFQQVNLLPSPTTTLRLAAINPLTCVSCNDQFVVSNPSGPHIIAVRPYGPAGSNPAASPIALCVFDDSINDITGQMVTDYGTTGTVTSLGGGCGSSGTTGGGLGLPTIGSLYRDQRAFLPATTLLGIYNLAPAGGTLVPCGACAWVPFSSTVTVPAASQRVEVAFTIPCVPAFVGQQFETQWAFLDPTQTPCPVFPGLLLTNRLLLTIGQ